MICGSPRPLQWAAAGLLAATLHWQAVAAGLEARIESSSHQPIEDVAVILEPIDAPVSPHGRKAVFEIGHGVSLLASLWRPIRQWHAAPP